MRRLLASLALAALTWSQVAALHCEDGRAETVAHHASQAPGHHASPSHDGMAYGSHGVPARTEAAARPHAGHDDTGCGLPMACGSAAVEPSGPERVVQAPMPSFGAPAADATRTGTPLGTDPPPPRSVV